VVIDHIEGRLWDIFGSQVPEKLHEDMGDSDDFTMAHLNMAQEIFEQAQQISTEQAYRKCRSIVLA